jgi:hypothetical protein
MECEQGLAAPSAVLDDDEPEMPGLPIADRLAVSA